MFYKFSILYQIDTRSWLEILVSMHLCSVICCQYLFSKCEDWLEADQTTVYLIYSILSFTEVKKNSVKINLPKENVQIQIKRLRHPYKLWSSSKFMNFLDVIENVKAWWDSWRFPCFKIITFVNNVCCLDPIKVTLESISWLDTYHHELSSDLLNLHCQLYILYANDKIKHKVSVGHIVSFWSLWYLCPQKQTYCVSFLVQKLEHFDSFWAW